MKKWIKGIVAAVVAIGVLIGGLFTYQNMKDKDKTAEVHSVANMNYGWMGEDMTSSGMVISRETQEYFRTGEQMVTQVFVTPGQQVNAGDALFAYDVETQRLAVELKQIEVNNEEKHIQDLYKELNEIRAMKPYVPRPTPEPTPIPTIEPEPQPTQEPTPIPTAEPEPTEDIPQKRQVEDAWTVLDDLQNPIQKEASGTKEDPLRFLVTEDAEIYGRFFNAIRESKQYAIIEVREDNKVDGELLSSYSVDGKRLKEVDGDRLFNLFPSFEDKSASVRNFGTLIHMPFIWNRQGETPATAPSNTEGSNSSNSNDGSSSSGENSNSSTNEDGTSNEESPIVLPDIYEDDSSGYTAQEIAEMAKDKEEEIRHADYLLRRSQLELKVMREALGDGMVYSKQPGTVTIAHNAGEITPDNEPFVKVTAGSGVTIQGTVSELMLDKVKIGQTVRASSWETGGEYLATVSAIDDYPVTQDYYYGGGNPNVSYYAFYATIAQAELPEYSYLELRLDSSEVETDLLYIERSYIREDNQGKYVMKDEEGVLKKQYIKTGRVLWGETVEILEGLTLEDSIAFPYGDGAIEGVKTVQAEEGGMFY